MSKQKKKESPALVPVDYPSFQRSQVVKALGENAKLRPAFYVKRRHIMDAYGITRHTFRQLVDSGQLEKKHFVFKEVAAVAAEND